jgi:hypothetical protein
MKVSPMDQIPNTWKEVHRHRGVVTTLGWSPSGDHLSCASFDGELVVVAAKGWKLSRLSPPGANRNAPQNGLITTWATNETIAIASRDGIGVIDLHGRERKPVQDEFLWKLLARPVLGGYAGVRFEEDGSRECVVITDERFQEVRQFENTYSRVIDLVWSPDGRLLLIVCNWGVHIEGSQPGSGAVPGGANEAVWLDAHQLAVGCLDGNIRIYDCTSRCHSGSLLAIHVLESHQAPVIRVAGPGRDGAFASLDDSGRMYVWARSVNGYGIAHAEILELSDGPANVAIALHPTLSLIAVDTACVLRIKQLIFASPAPTFTPANQHDADLETLLSGALADEAHINSDTVCKVWGLTAYWEPPYDEKIQLTQDCRDIAESSRSLLRDIRLALVDLWSTAKSSVVLELEQLCIGGTTPPHGVTELRGRLLALLADAIRSDHSPQRGLASAIYVALGHLGPEEARAAFGPQSQLKALLPHFDRRFRLCSLKGAKLPEERSGLEIKIALRNVAQLVSAALADGHNLRGRRLVSLNPHTLILKGGGAKGLAHIGAVLEIRQHFLFDRFVGTSAGAIVAVLLGAGLSDAELESELVKTDFSTLVHEPWWQLVYQLFLRGACTPARVLSTGWTGYWQGSWGRRPR